MKQIREYALSIIEYMKENDCNANKVDIYNEFYKSLELYFQEKNQLFSRDEALNYLFSIKQSKHNINSLYIDALKKLCYMFDGKEICNTFIVITKKFNELSDIFKKIVVRLEK